VANYKISMNKVTETKVHRQSQNVTAKKQLMFKYISIYNNNNITVIIIIMIVVMMEFIMVIMIIIIMIIQ
jgi:hypothetical protein